MKSKILTSLENHNCERITQGDILRDFEFYFVNSQKSVIEISFQYIVVFSQDCDLEQGQKDFNYFVLKDSIDSIKFNQFLPNILFSPAFLMAEIKEGIHLKNEFNIICDTINTDRLKLIKQNRDDRYHFIKGNQDLQVPDLIVDFKIYFTVPTDYFLSHYEKCYLSTINEMFRENLSQRYCNYLNRIGLPEL